MYSPEIEKILKAKKISVGDRIRLAKNGTLYEGMLMPKADSGDPSVLVIKLASGYNVGLDFKGAQITKLPGHAENLGKVGKDLLQLRFDPKKPPVALVSSGGTIASRVDYRTGGVSAAEEPRDFLHNVPELAQIINLTSISKPVTRMSEDLGHEDWIAMARAIHKDLKTNEGVILTHGTDTLHYTAAALSFFLRNLSKPVVLVGGQKSSDRGSSDVGMNLICAAHVAVGNFAEVGTCMHGSSNDDYCYFIRGTRVRKLHTVRRDAFKPVNDLPIAKVFPDGKMDIVNKNYKKRSDAEALLDAKFEPKVALVKSYPSSDPDVLEFYLGKKIKGFVIEGMGLGHVPTFAAKSWIPAIKKIVKDGIPVFVTSQTIYGRVNPNVYTNLRVLYHESGAIPAEDMLTEVAFVKLGWVLAHTTDLEEVRKQMLKNVAGEISDRSTSETFLYK